MSSSRFDPLGAELPEVAAASVWPATDQDSGWERIFAGGSDALADQEILECLLFAPSGRRDRQLAGTLLTRFGSFANVITAPVWDLLAVAGIKVAQVGVLKSVDTAARRLMRMEVIGKPVFSNWHKLMGYLHAELSRETVEQFRVLFLDNQNRLLADELLQRGTVSHTPVYPREVVKRALELHAIALIVVHNHPSGDPTPTPDDLDMTQQIAAAAAALSIVLHDHIVIGNGRWFSFREKGLLGPAIN